MIKLYAFLTIALFIGGVVYSGYSYFQKTQQELIMLQKNITTYENAIKSTSEAMDRMRQETDRIQEINDQLNNKLKKAEEYKDELTKKLNEHNLTKLSTAKPGLIEKRVNDATTKIFKELEDITAVPASR